MNEKEAFGFIDWRKWREEKEMCIGQQLITNSCSFLLNGVVGGSELANWMHSRVPGRVW